MSQQKIVNTPIDPVPAPLNQVIPLPPPPAYKDLFKQSRDVLEEGFVRDFNVKFENLGDASSSFTVDLTHTGLQGKEGAIRGSLKQKVDSLWHNGFVHELTFFSDNRFRWELSTPVYNFSSLLTKLRLAHDFNGDTLDAKLSPTLELKNEKVNVSVAIESPYSLALTKNADGVQVREVPYVPHRLSFQSSFRIVPSLFAGLSALFSSTGTWDTVGLKTEWSGSSYIAGFAVNQDNGVNKPLLKSFYLFTPFHSGLGKPNKLSFIATHGNALSATFGVETALNDLTTIKTKVDNAGSVGLSLQQRFSSFGKITGSCVFSLSTNLPVYGVSFSFSDKY